VDPRFRLSWRSCRRRPPTLLREAGASRNALVAAGVVFLGLVATFLLPPQRHEDL
jgi:hypothetical protein